MIGVIMVKLKGTEGSSKMDRNNNPHKANLCNGGNNTMGLTRSYRLDHNHPLNQSNFSPILINLIF